MTSFFKKYSSPLSIHRYSAALVDQAIVSGGNFLTIAVCARILPMFDQGKFGYILSAYMAAVVLNMTAVFQWASIQAPLQEDKISYRKMLAGAQLLLAVLFAIAMTACITVLGTLSGWIPTLGEVMLTAAFILFQQLADFERRSSYIFFNAARAAKSSVFIYPLRIVLLILIRPGSVFEVMLVLTATSLGPSLYTLYLCFRGGFEVGKTLSFLKMEFSGSRWLVVSGPLIWLWAYLPVYALGWIVNVAAVGAYITIRSLVNFTNVLMELLETEVSAKAGRAFVEDYEGFKVKLRSITLLGSGLWLIGLFAIWFFGKEILLLFYGEQYARYSPILLILWFAQLFMFLFRVNSIKLRTTGMTFAVPASYATGVVAVLAAFYPLLTYFNINGAAWLYFAGAGTVLLSQYLMAGFL